MKLDVSQAIRFPGTPYSFEAEQAIAPQEIGGDTVTYDPVMLKGVFTGTENGNILVDGSLTTVAHSRCANCLASADAVISTDFSETFVRNGDPEDDEIFSYEGYRIDLEKLTMSCAVLETPMRFLCKEGCNGAKAFKVADVDVCLCPEELSGQHPFAALQQLLADNAGEKAE